MRTQGITIQPVSEVSRGDLVRAVNAAYADYYVSIYLTPDSFERLLERESVRLSASAVALEGRKIVGMGLLGVRGRRGWIGGMGVLPRYRDRGIGRRLMERLIEQAREADLDTVQLEVITQNERAYHLYQSLGFETIRRLLVLTWTDSLIPLPEYAPQPGIHIDREPPDRLVDEMQPLITVRRPWQRERTAFHITAPRLNGLAARDPEGRLLGACLYRVEGFQAGIMDMVATGLEIGDLMLAYMLSRLAVSHLSYVNQAEEDPLVPVFQDAGFEETLSQYEMILRLTPEASP